MVCLTVRQADIDFYLNDKYIINFCEREQEINYNYHKRVIIFVYTSEKG
jgi:hypothetical protein